MTLHDLFAARKSNNPLHAARVIANFTRLAISSTALDAALKTNARCWLPTRGEDYRVELIAHGPVRPGCTRDTCGRESGDASISPSREWQVSARAVIVDGIPVERTYDRIVELIDSAISCHALGPWSLVAYPNSTITGMGMNAAACFAPWPWQHDPRDQPRYWFTRAPSNGAPTKEPEGTRGTGSTST